MNQGKVKIGVGRTIAGIALGALLALVSPLMLIVEVFSLATAVLPSIGLVALYRWAGRIPALVCALLTLMFSSLFAGAPFSLAMLLVSVLPPMLLLLWQDRPFFDQLRRSIAAFGIGLLGAVAVIYFSYGGNMIERLFGQFPDMVRALPEEYLAPMLQSVSALLGRTVTAGSFYELYDSMIAELVPLYQRYMPQCLFSGALFSALACAWVSNRMRARRGDAAPGSYVPLRGWALPASTTGGLALMLLVSWLLDAIDVRGGETLYWAVYGIAVVAFGAQTLGSAARRLHSTRLGLGGQHAILMLILILGGMWLPDAMLVYGCASAVLGSRGVMAQRARRRGGDDRPGGEK